MKIRVIWVGKTRNRGLAAVSDDLAKRIRHFIGLDIVTLKESRISDDRKRLGSEESKILKTLGRSDRVIGLDPRGRRYDSSGFAKLLGTHMREDPRDLTFVVGGPAGLSAEVKKRADSLWSLSPLTFSHELARTVMLEQTYRALTMIHNLPYAR